MQNKVYQSSQRVYAIAPAGGVKGGDAVRYGGIFGFAVTDAAAGEQYTLDCEGQWGVKMEAVGAPISFGDAVYFEANRADAQFSNEATAGATLVGYSTRFTPIAAGEVGDGLLCISPMPRTTAAEAIENAGGADA